jgi:hypothetical protein
MAQRRNDDLAHRTYLRSPRKLRALVDAEREQLLLGYEDWLCDIVNGNEDCGTFAEMLDSCIQAALWHGVAIGQRHPKLTRGAII